MADISCCGCVCSECKDYGQSCAGCSAIRGKVFWAGQLGEDVCPIYACCVSQKGHEDCGQCGNLPCEVYHRCADPFMTKEQHEQFVAERVSVLKSRKK